MGKICEISIKTEMMSDRQNLISLKKLDFEINFENYCYND